MRLTRIAGAAVLLLALATGCGGSERAKKPVANDPSKAAVSALKDYLHAFQSGEAEKACALESSDYSRAQVQDATKQKLIGASATCEDLVNTAIAAAKELGADFESVSRTEMEVRDSAQDHVTVQVKYPDSTVSSGETYTLVLTDGHWLVDSKVTGSN